MKKPSPCLVTSSWTMLARILVTLVSAVAVLAISAVPAAAANYLCSWNGSTANWSATGDWTVCNGVYPNNGGGNTYDATIATSGSYAVTLSSPVTIGTLTLNNSNATLLNSSTLTTTGGVNLQAGTLSGGTYAVTGGGTTAVALSSSYASGTLNFVTLNGSLDVTGYGAVAYFSNGLTVNNTAGASPGVINVTGSYSQLDSTGTQTLDNATVHLGGTSGYGYLSSQTGTLTLGSNLHVLADGSGSYTYLAGDTIVNNGTIAYSNGVGNNYLEPNNFTNNGTVSLTGTGTGVYGGGSTFTNNGAITAATGTTLNVSGSSMTNSGTGQITGADGSSISLSPYGTLTNAGTVTMNGAGGATMLQIGYASNQGANTAYEWTNTGTINVTQTDLRLGGYFTQSDIGTINRTGGTVSLNGYLNNSASTLNIQTGPLAGLAMIGGTIHGGLIQGGSSNLFTNSSASGTLDNVTLNGSLDVTGYGAVAYFSNGLTVNNTAGASPGVINVTGSYSQLDSTGTQTLDNATVHLGGTSGYGYLNSQTGTLTLGSNLHVLADGSGSYTYLAGDTIVNNGTIAYSNGVGNNYLEPNNFTNNGTVSLTGTGTGVYGGGSTFTNNGAITAATGTTLNVSGSSMTNSGTGQITGADGSSISLSPYGTLTNAGTVTMNGAGGATMLQIGYASNQGANTAYEWTNTGTINVTQTDLRLGGYFTQSDIGTINRTGGTVSLNGYLNNSASTLNIQTGPLAGLAMIGGTIHGGLIQGGSSNLFTNSSASGTLDNVTLNGSLDVTGYGAVAYFSNGLTVNNTAGASPGVINVTGSYSQLDSTGTQTLDNATVHLGGTSGYGYLSSQTGTLTLGSNLHVLADGSGSYTYLAGDTIVNNGTIAYSNGAGNNYLQPTNFTNNGTVSLTGTGTVVYGGGSTFTNNGAITAATGTTLNVSGSSMTNSGTGQITGADGSSISLSPYGTLTNAGTVTMNGAGGATMLQIGYASNQGANTAYEWTNTGTINVTQTDLRLGGYFTQSDIGTINRTGGTVSLNGYLNNSASTLNIQTGPLAGLAMIGGTIHGGLIQGGSSNLFTNSSASGTLDNVTLNGSLDVTGYGAVAYFSNGLTVNNTAGASPGVINVTGSYSQLDSTGTQTLDNATVHLGGTSGYGYLNSQTGMLTLGSNLHVLADGSGSYTYLAGDTIVNNGTIAYSNGSGSNYIAPTNFTNNGIVSASNNSTVYIEPTTFSNFSSGTLTGGSYQAYAGSTLDIYNAPVITLAADAVLSGTGSQIQSYNTSNGTFTPLESSLTTIASTGALHVLASRSYATINSITNHGLLELGGGTFTAPSVTSSGTVRGFGTIVPLINNTGLVEAKGGTLTTQNGIQGTGNILTDSGATLNLNGASYTATSFTNNGTTFGSGTVTPLIANTGLVEANGGTLAAQHGIQGIGNITADSGATLNLSSATVASTAGTLTVNGLVNLGNQNLVVSSDYVNGNFGSGNSFNKRDNVSGAGQIDAAGNVTQVVTGTNISGGTSATPTLNFGNIHVGDTITQAYQIANGGTTGPALRGAIQTTVNGGNITDARLSGTGVTAGNFGPIATGSNSGDLSVTLNGTSAGVLTGQAVHIANNFGNVGEQTVSITGGIYRLAQANTVAPVNFGNVHVGDTVSQALTIQNTAANDGFSEKLDASFGGSSDSRITNNGGSISLLAAGATDAASMTVGLNTLAAGSVNGTITVNLDSNGSGTSGLGITALPSQNVAVTGAIQGNVYRLASASAATPNPVSFGNVRVGTATDQALTIQNTAANDGFSEKLDASIGGASTGVTASGTFNLLAAQSTDSSSLHVGIDTSTAGAKSGSATITLNSDGTGTSGLGITALPSQTVNVSGNVYRLAQGSTTPATPITFGSVRLNSGASQALTVANTAANDGYSESLNAAFGTTTGNATHNLGSVNLLAAGATNSAAMSVGIDTSSVGAKSGSVTLNYQSDGTGTSGLAAIAAGSQTINVSGAVYRTAQGDTNPLAVNFNNMHVGDSANQALTIQNLAANDGFSEKLNASFGATTGAATNNSGSVGLLAAGGSNNTNMAVGLNTSSAGAKSGTVAVSYQSDGTGTSGLSAIGAGGQSVSIIGNVYRLAQANTLGAINFGNVHVGDSVSQALTIQNTAANDGFSEKLDASFGGSSDSRITNNGGSISLLGAGATDAASMTVGLNTSLAGSVSGTTTVKFNSNGSGTSGLGITALPSQDVAVTGVIGNVYRLASASAATPNPVSFGNVRVGTATDQALTIQNTAANDGFSEKLDASIGGASTGVTASGTFNLLAAQSTDSSSLHVGIDTSTAGAKSGSATITLNSDGTGTSGLGITALPSQTVNVSGNVYRLAQGSTTPATPITFGSVRLNSGASQALTVANTAANDGYSESLNAAFGTTTGNATHNLGSVNLLAAGATNSAAMSVGIDTSSVGAKSGSVTLNYQSDGTGTSGLAAIAAGSQTINVSGAVYRTAQGDTNPLAVNFNNMHVGDSANQALTIQNLAANDGFSEKLNASFGATTGAATNNSGSVGLLAAGGSNNTNMAVGLNTSSAGAKSGTVAVSYQSDGTGTSGLSAIGAGGQSVSIIGNVYRLAQANTLGAINFGNVHVGDSVSQALTIQNTAANDGFSEKLDASFGGSSDSRITNNGGSISLLGAGATDAASMTVGLNTSLAGSVSGTTTVKFNSNGSGTSGLGITALPSQDVAVTGVIGNVYRLASASAATPNPVSFGNVRVGTATDQALTIQNTAANDGFSEKLDASIGGASTGVTASGTFNLLAAQSTDSSSLHVGIDTSTAGAKSGSATITLNSDGTGTSGLGITALPSQTVNVSGNVYRLASPTLNTSNVTLVARVGDSAPSANVSVTNSSPDAYTEGLKASIGPATTPFTSGGSIANLAAQGTDASSLHVGLNTVAAGASASTATVNFTSTGAGTDNAADLSVGSAVVNLVGKVYQQAVAQVNTVAVNFGIVHVGDNNVSQAVSVTNAAPVAGLNDVLKGSLAGAGGVFSTSGTLGTTGVAAGATDNSSLKVALNTATAGIFSGSTTGNFVSHDADLADLVLNGIPVSLTAQVNNYANADIIDAGGAGALSRNGNVFTLDFGHVHQGSGTLSADLAVLNDVSGPADLLSGFFDLTGANDYTFNGFNPFTDLAAGISQGGYDISFDTGVLGNFSDSIVLSANGSNASGYSGDLSQITLLIQGDVIANTTTVPEPATLFLFALGLVGILVVRRAPSAG